ncbi:trichome differentiation protein GL1, putative [Entamoeba invadens IP1]|uniref:trichome differentiation protein GL1, putative n=1 Tax=Entamoeba invadens IP1 TaxID=370355 RepID=UPI0002C3F69D|nr:trichome differentiation protein GL1, putative [Entamoeba invadens IP1]ELP85061.1 trichome differentiation protein GL1, putative [Entamoeba invadens IP1]|eukprot:XP_004184407.1 trichome differentiation protein GL1, putative [Entamoeba invadens IP1]
MLASSSTSVAETSEHKTKKQRKVNWTKEEDEQLLALVQDVEIIDWDMVAIPNRTKKQCKEHFVNCLSEKVSHKPWSIEEDNMIYSLQKEHGNKWTLFSQHFIGRTPNSLKNRFYSHVNKAPRKEEDGDVQTKMAELRSALKSKFTKDFQKSPPSAFIPIKDNSFEVL